MMYIWNYEGIRISDIMQVVADKGGNVTIRGTVVRESVHNNFHTRQFEWHAIALPSGWYVDILGKGSMQSKTFNLPLEVATAIRLLT